MSVFRAARKIKTLRSLADLVPRVSSGARSAVRPPSFFGESTPLFFVVGYQKSGTRWLMKMLDVHPEILCQGEGRPFGRTWRWDHDSRGRRDRALRRLPRYQLRLLLLARVRPGDIRGRRGRGQDRSLAGGASRQRGLVHFGQPSIAPLARGAGGLPRAGVVSREEATVGSRFWSEAIICSYAHCSAVVERRGRAGGHR